MSECENCQKLQNKIDRLIAALKMIKDADCVYCGQSIWRSVEDDFERIINGEDANE